MREFWPSARALKPSFVDTFTGLKTVNVLSAKSIQSSLCSLTLTNSSQSSKFLSPAVFVAFPLIGFFGLFIVAFNNTAKRDHLI
ncbi:hypothetical protein KT71_001939 [Congregibacter litoralis KT71]|uniref:Uncharacterized protein n=1 Tax=Congregibacter litoralis KT71 TaxID=314285 RepID=V7HVN1_9GAMM|nr:hypothetical protein KT71_001939 [Congregibacter litoralis KT71]